MTSKPFPRPMTSSTRRAVKDRLSCSVRSTGTTTALSAESMAILTPTANSESLNTLPVRMGIRFRVISDPTLRYKTRHNSNTE
ncbi:unnamed protein product, partial [Oppiella nova]